MTIAYEPLAVILFVAGILVIALSLLIGLYLLFRDPQQDGKKPRKRFLLSNWK